MASEDAPGIDLLAADLTRSWRLDGVGETIRFAFHRHRVQIGMVIAGLIFLLLGAVLATPILWTIGIILVVIGLVLMLAGRSGRQVGGRAHYW